MINNVEWNRNGLRIASSVRVLLYIFSFYVAITSLVSGQDIPIENNSWQEWIMFVAVGVVFISLFVVMIYLILNAAVWILFLLMFKKNVREIMQERLLSNRIFFLDFSKIEEDEVVAYATYIESKLDKDMVASIKGLANGIDTVEESRSAIITISEYVAAMYYLGGPAYSSLVDRELVQCIDEIVKDENGNYRAGKSWIVGLLTDLQYHVSGYLDDETI